MNDKGVGPEEEWKDNFAFLVGGEIVLTYTVRLALEVTQPRDEYDTGEAAKKHDESVGEIPRPK